MRERSSSHLIDSYGRYMKKLRLSLLDACNFRCVYCMPEKAQFTPSKDYLKTEDLLRIVKNFVSFGVEEVRLTGGEPTLRKDWLVVAQKLSELPLRKLGLTTNGFNLHKSIEDLSRTQCQYINISIDSLRKEKFNSITRRPFYDDVMKSIFMAKEFGFNLKLNVVVMKSVNDDEVIDFVRFSQKYDIDVRFLETMNIGVARPHFEKWFIPAQSLINNIEAHFDWTKRDREADDTAFCYDLSGGGRIGFIASESQSFCQGCSRLRLDAKGVLRPCLFKEQGLSFKDISLEDYPKALSETMRLKPIEREKELAQPMYQVGG